MGLPLSFLGLIEWTSDRAGISAGLCAEEVLVDSAIERKPDSAAIGGASAAQVTAATRRMRIVGIGLRVG